MSIWTARVFLPVLSISAVFASGCTNTRQCGADLANRAYIVSRDSDEVHLIDLSNLEVCGVAHTRGQALHMGELSADLTQIFVSSESTNETVVVDTRTLAVVKRIPTAASPTHLTLSRDGKYLGISAEYGDVVHFVDAHTGALVHTVDGLHTPHFVRYSLDGKEAYVANIGAHHLTRIDLASFAIVDEIALDGFEGGYLEAPDEGGFADAQIDQVTGLLYAAHRATGRVLVYDTIQHRKLPELSVGKMPWIVYAEHPFAAVSRRHVVPNFVDRSASVLQGDASAVAATLPYADDQSFGVNYSPLVPDLAFLMNRMKHEVAVVNTATMALVDRIDVGGTTETASTTPDGKWIVATVSSANRVVVIDAVTRKVVKAFDNLGHYPWSVTIPAGQNYCH